jgi:hypothetical protein
MTNHDVHAAVQRGSRGAAFDMVMHRARRTRPWAAMPTVVPAVVAAVLCGGPSRAVEPRTQYLPLMQSSRWSLP